MREILFRGQSFDGIWVYGYLVETKEHTIILFDDCYDEELKYNFGENIVYVIPESVGQYTGWEDKNGHKIFEGDILELSHDSEYYNGSEPIIIKIANIGVQYAYKSEPNWPYSLESEFDFENWIVLGNVFDNPELLY